ncbi:GNAT family N-acetyltransferase [Anaerorhabdus sp.]|uniref:GNAT family N-acetyltransferase n=1 Tax=Anaerorhabdus sp. TaxID=1872524 RepID=UPI002B20D0AF|nr:GNAT family N-acetyltransferase [Anaerorhabdus sp.]MEA4875569.1 GNAT family N-acetyltransferase [Anaerorhabdus sp.]
MEFIVRQARFEDYERLKVIYNDFIEDMNQYDPTDCNMDDEINNWITNGLNKKKSVIYIAELDEDILGFIRLQNKERLEENKTIRYIKLSDLFVAPMFRKIGVASSLINQAYMFARENHSTEIVLNVYETNTKAKDFYVKQDFKFHETLALNRVRMIRELK